MNRPGRNNWNRVLLVDVRCYKNEMIPRTFFWSPDSARNGVFPASFRPFLLILPREPAGKPTEGGSSIPDGVCPYQKQNSSRFFPQAENLRKPKDLTENNRERPRSVQEIRRIRTDSSSKRIQLSDFNHISKKNR
jgi:hypothetical protein